MVDALQLLDVQSVCVFRRSVFLLADISTFNFSNRVYLSFRLVKWGKATGEVHMDILKKIELYRQEEEMLKWEGTFAEYLEIIKEKPWVAQSAHSRVYNMIKDAGVEEENGHKKV